MSVGQVTAAMLPPLVRWGFVLHVPIAFVAGLALSLVPSGVLLAAARLGTPGMHWTEKARRLLPAGAAILVSQIAALGIGMVAYNWCGPLSYAAPAIDALLASLSAFAGASFGASLVGRYLGRIHNFPPGTRIAALFGSYLCLLPLGASYFLVLFVKPEKDAWGLALGALALALLLVSMVQGLRVRRLCGVARPASASLREGVAAVAIRMGVPAPEVFEIELQIANAMAFTFERAIGFTTGALHVLSRSEVASVAAHEIAHLHEDAAARYVRLVTPAAMLVFLAMLVRYPNPLTLVCGYIAVVGIAWLVNWRKRALERRADAAGARHQDDPGVYALALLRLYEANLFPAVQGRGGTHSSLYDRLVAAGVRPEFPRPRPPALRGVLVSTMLMTVLVVGAAWYRDRDSPSASVWRLAIFGSSAHQLALWADVARQRGLLQAETELLEASVQADPDDPTHRLPLIRSLAARHQCGRAAELATMLGTGVVSPAEQAEAKKLVVGCHP